MWKRIFSCFIKDEPLNTFVLPEPSKPYRKPSDSTKLTKGMYDFVIEMKAAQEEHNRYKDVYGDFHFQTTEELCDYLNMVFGTNFSRSKLTRIWTGHVNREDLPVGIAYTISF